MAPLLLYLIQSGICLGLFYLFFMLVMRRSTLFRFNRLTLLAGSLVCLVLPLFPITVSEPQLVQQPMQTLSELLTVPEETDKMLMTLPTEEAEQLILHAHDDTRLSGCLSVLYLTGALITLALTALSFVRIWRLIRRAPYREENGYRLIVLPQPVHSFSFGRYIVLSEEDYRESPYVLIHERMHLRYRHTWDSLWFIAVVIVYWFNPLVWLMRLEMQQLHEYEADEGVIHQGINATQYQLLLVKKAVGTRLYSMANGFNHSKLKNRITMMLEKRTNGWARLKVLLAVPVAMGTLLAFARPEVKETLKTIVPQVEQQDSLNTLEGLKNFFYQKGNEYGEKYQKLPDGDYNVKEEQVFNFCVNQQNQVLTSHHLSNPKGKGWKPYEINNLRREMVQHLKEVHQMFKSSGKDEAIIIRFQYDTVAHQDSLVSYLKQIKLAIDDVRQDYAEADRDKYSPYALYFAEPKRYGENRRIKTIELTFIDHGNEKLENKKTLRNFSLVELEKALKEYTGNKEHLEVSMKVSQNAPLRDVNDIKETLRKAYALKLSIENQK